jgi:NADH oxidase (H2O2-forming)
MSINLEQKIVIIGDGIAGYTAARRMRSLAPNADVTLIGAEAVPLYSACALPDYLHGYQTRERVFIPDLPEARALQVHKAVMAESVNAESQTVTFNGQAIPYDKLILATGSVAVIPPVPGAEIPGNFTLKTLSDVDKIIAWGGRSATVVGSGAIGLETSMALRARGLDVTLIEMLDRIMSTAFDKNAARILQSVAEGHGVRILTGEKVLGVEGAERVAGVATTQGRIDCDLVVWAAGVRPNNVLAREAGIEIGSCRGIKVNDRMETSVQNIYACGDCVEVWERVLHRPALSLLWASAKEQAEIAACNSLGIERIYQGALGVVVEEIGDLTAVSAGYSESSLEDEDIKFDVHESNTEQGYYKIICDHEKILGVQLVGCCGGAGAVIALIKKEASPQQVLDVLHDEISLKAAPWYYQAARFFQ